MTFLDHVAEESASVFAGAEFSEVATYTPAGGSGRSVRGVFDRVSEVSDIGELVEHDGVAAVFATATASIPEVAIGDRLLIRSTDYGIYGIEPDGTGMTRLVLSL